MKNTRQTIFMWGSMGCLLLSLAGCKQEEDYRTPILQDIIGSWTTSGPVFESGGAMPTQEQLSYFKTLEASAYSFNPDSTYLKQAIDSTTVAHQVIIREEKGSYTLRGDTLTLLTLDTITHQTRRTYYHCYFAKRLLNFQAFNSMIIRTTKALLVKELIEHGQADPFYKEKLAFLNQRDLFKVSLTLQQ